MEFEIGDKVVRKTSMNNGFVHSKRSGRVLMLEVRWESGGKQWLPAEEFMLWNKPEEPPPVVTGWRGRTTPEYIVNLRNSKQVRDQRRQHFASIDNMDKRISDSLAELGNSNKSRMKARKMIAKYQKQKDMTKPCWNYAKGSPEAERLAMKKLYQAKSGDYSY